MRNIDTAAYHVAAAQNEHNASALSCVPPKFHLSPSAYWSVVTSNLQAHGLGLSQIPETPPYLGIWRTTDYLCWVAVRAEGHGIGVGVLRDRHWEGRGR